MAWHPDRLRSWNTIRNDTPAEASPAESCHERALAGDGHSAMHSVEALARDVAPAACRPDSRARASMPGDSMPGDSIPEHQRSWTLALTGDSDDLLGETWKARSPDSPTISSDSPGAPDIPDSPGVQPRGKNGDTEQPITRIKQYEIIRELGRGGMGAVFLARDLKLGRRVAVKFLRNQGPRQARRFIMEARATARCSHENIVVIHDVDQIDDTPYMVLEYLEGRPFSALLGHGRIAANRAVELIVPVVRALSRAHEFNIVHRDLKPENIYLTDSGTVKVLDFGIAKFLPQAGIGAATGTTPAAGIFAQPDDVTRVGAMLGTIPYMAPEQWRGEGVDHRTDFWALGVILFTMVTGQHPLAPLCGIQLRVTTRMDQPMPSVRDTGVVMPEELVTIIDRCLRKEQADRFASAGQLLAALEPLLPERYARDLKGEENPYAGLTAFQETDASRFFGRSREITQMLGRLHDCPLIGVVGPSGIGKSSFVRAGVIPTLKHSGESWESIVVRPGRHPLAALASIVAPMLTDDSADLSDRIAQHQDTLNRLYAEPGYLGAVLRARARKHDRKILLFVDQFEELYTLIPDQRERRSFTACLGGIADDETSPLRVIISLRSDFLDRAAEDARFIAELGRRLFFLTAPDRDALREALIQPAAMMRLRFETPDLIKRMLDTLETTPAPLPLLQFTATKLWDARDAERRLLTEVSYSEIGGVSGALASHADAVLGDLSADALRLAETLFVHLVTPERTRAIMSAKELCELSDDPDEVQRLIDRLVDARLLVSQVAASSEGTQVEIVHESLIHTWPTLNRWLDDHQEDATYLEQVRLVARRWDERGRPPGLLWRGEAMEDARRWHRRYRGKLSSLQTDYLHQVFSLADRTVRRKRLAIIAAFAVLVLLVVAAAVGLVLIHRAEQRASEQATIAQGAEKRARDQATAARAAESQVREQLAVIEKKERQRRTAEQRAARADAAVVLSREELASANEELRQALSAARKSRERVTAALEAAEREKARAEKLSEERRERLERLRSLIGGVGTGLK